MFCPAVAKGDRRQSCALGSVISKSRGSLNTTSCSVFFLPRPSTSAAASLLTIIDKALLASIKAVANSIN
jgi:hypothetical protein